MLFSVFFLFTVRFNFPIPSCCSSSKQFIRKHWQEGEDGFEHPAVSSEEKLPY
ncbi:hypothetical protein Tsubulata_014398 [Turnera subulata]|uniref:Uncharacterized protein n=1 Tax=Turnera subulata TaxID=218843 RepID=A0A9Q0GFS1_9ROSI|nr:hypothetical protein Tsubulata_014398 [Turnera subulata]